jgi:hypothetical protein
VSERQHAKLENMLQKRMETTAEKPCQHEKNCKRTEKSNASNQTLNVMNATLSQNV